MSKRVMKGKRNVKVVIVMLVMAALLGTSAVNVNASEIPDTLEVTPTPEGKIVKGIDGWYYIANANNLDIAIGTFPLQKSDYTNIAKRVENIGNYLKSKGIDLYVVSVPSKVSVYPEYLDGKHTVIETPCDMFTETLQKNTNVKAYNLKPVLLEKKKEQQIYFKTDSHWNHIGAYEGYKYLYQIMKKDGVINNNMTSVNMEEAVWIGEFNSMSDINEREKYIKCSVANPKAVKVTSGTKYQKMKEFQQKEGDVACDWRLYKNESLSNGKKAVFFVDSLFASWNVPEEFAENFSETLFVWRSGITQDVIDYFKPDVVVYEIAERAVVLVDDSCDFYWDQTFKPRQVINPNFEFVSYKVNAYDRKTQNATISVTVKNTSGSSWKRQDMIRGCLFDKNGDDIGLRAYLNEVTEVMPNQTVTFTFTNVPVINSNNLSFAMVQDGFTYFGEQQNIEIK